MIEITFQFLESLRGERSYVAWAEVESNVIPDRKTSWFLVTHGESWEDLSVNLRKLVKARSREIDLHPDPICLRVEKAERPLPALWVLPGVRSEGILDGLATALNPRGRSLMEKYGGTVSVRWLNKILLVLQPDGGLYPEEITLILDWAFRDIPANGLSEPPPTGTTRRDLLWSILGGSER